MTRKPLLALALGLVLLVGAPPTASAGWPQNCLDAIKGVLAKMRLKKNPPVVAGEAGEVAAADAAAGGDRAAVQVEPRPQGPIERRLPGPERPLPPKYEATLKDVREKLEAWAKKIPSLKTDLPSGIPVAQKHFVELADKMMHDPQRFAQWLGDLVEETGREMANHPSEHVRKLAAEGKLDQGSLLRVVQRRANELGFGKIKTLNGKLKVKTSVTVATDFNQATKGGTLFFDMPFRKGNHGRDFHALQVLYVAGEAGPGEGRAFMKWVNESSKGGDVWNKLFDSFVGDLTHPERSNPELRKILPFD